MTSKQVLKVLDELSFNQQDVAEYIKSFDSTNYGFLYTEEVDPVRIALKVKMNKLDDGSYSGASWGWMMREVQAVLNGVKSYEDIVIRKNKDDEYFRQWLVQEEQRQKAEQQRQPPAQE